MNIVTKKDLSDNYGKPVFYFTKFFPEIIKLVKSEEMKNEKQNPLKVNKNEH